MAVQAQWLVTFLTVWFSASLSSVAQMPALGSGRSARGMGAPGSGFGATGPGKMALGGPSSGSGATRSGMAAPGPYFSATGTGTGLGMGANRAGPGASSSSNRISNRIFAFDLTPNMSTADLDNPSSALRRLITYIVKGAASPSRYLSVLPGYGRSPELQIQIRDDSIFVPGGNAANAQRGFRRTDVLPAINKPAALSGITTFYQTIRLDSRAPLALAHGYLFASIELPTGDHVWDIFAGSDFDSENTAHTPTSNSQTIRVRDLRTHTVYSLPLSYDQAYNIAITVDWSANTLTVYASTGNDPLRLVSGPVTNDPKATSSSGQGEYHIQLIKLSVLSHHAHIFLEKTQTSRIINADDMGLFEITLTTPNSPLPDANDPVSQRSDVPHHGFQEPIGQEHVSFSNVFVTSGKQIEQSPR